MKVVLLLLFSVICIRPSIVASQQHVRLTTTSANFDLSITFEQGRTLSINELFRFESATSKMFHTELSSDSISNADHAMPEVIVASVHVERMTKIDGGVGLTLKSVVSVTFLDVGLYNALEIAPSDGGLEANTATEVASLLTKSVSSGDILEVLAAEQLVASDTTVLGLTFTEFEGSSDERGAAATDADIVSKSVNDGWPMFFAGVMITLLFLGIATVGAWVYNKEFRSSKKTGDDDSCNSIHFKCDDNVEVATTASGILGGKGHHPQAGNDENAHPNSSAYRRNRLVADVNAARNSNSPISPRSGVVSVSSKHPLGISKLESILTPRRPKRYNDQTPMQDIDF
ncbi:hypothetical protein ACHAW5_001027 [Stephanodiscus triporus]|uniref:Uncharacterized protein n=1 Tax=Stephanodiscus triporus TaxID=2934178 RepID=A0ABD3PQD3_9STRA